MSMFYTKNLLFYTLHLFSSQTDSLGQCQIHLATLYAIYNIEYRVINDRNFYHLFSPRKNCTQSLKTGHQVNKDLEAIVCTISYVVAGR